MNLQSEHTCCGFTEPRRHTMLPSISFLFRIKREGPVWRQNTHEPKAKSVCREVRLSFAESWQVFRTNLTEKKGNVFSEKRCWISIRDFCWCSEKYVLFKNAQNASSIFNTCFCWKHEFSCATNLGVRTFFRGGGWVVRFHNVCPPTKKKVWARKLSILAQEVFDLREAGMLEKTKRSGSSAGRDLSLLRGTPRGSRVDIATFRKWLFWNRHNSQKTRWKRFASKMQKGLLNPKSQKAQLRIVRVALYWWFPKQHLTAGHMQDASSFGLSLFGWVRSSEIFFPKIVAVW